MKVRRRRKSQPSMTFNVTTWQQGVKDELGFAGLWKTIWLTQDAPFWLLAESVAHYDPTFLENRLITTVQVGLLSSCCRVARVYDHEAGFTVCYNCRTPMDYIDSIKLVSLETTIGSQRPGTTHVRAELADLRAYLLQGLDDDPRSNVLNNELIVESMVADVWLLAEYVLGNSEKVRRHGQ